MSIQKERKEKMMLDAAYHGLRSLLHKNTETFEGMLRFNPVNMKKYPSALRTVIQGSDSWLKPYLDNLVTSGLVDRDGTVGDYNVTVRDRPGLEALVKAHEDGGVELSDLVFKRAEEPQEEEEAGEEEPHMVPAGALFKIVEGMKILGEGMGLVRIELQHLTEINQGANKRIDTLEKQLEAALGALNGAIRTVQQVDSTKIFNSLADAARDQKDRHEAVLRHLSSLAEEVHTVSTSTSFIAADIKTREEDKLGRAVRDLQSVLDLLMEARG
jgi:hypothetical protein